MNMGALKHTKFGEHVQASLHFQKKKLNLAWNFPSIPTPMYPYRFRMWSMQIF